MKQFVCIALLIFIAANSYCQHQLKILVLNSGDRNPIAAATITLAPNSYAITDEAGSCSISIKHQATTIGLRISAAGFETKDTSISTSATRLIMYLEPMALLLQPVEVTAIRAGERSPFTKTNYNKVYIEKNNFGQDVPFILNQIPNVVVNSDAGNGIGYTGIRIRGTDATRINMTINGIPYNDGESQGVFLVNLPDFASSLSSVQIQRGVGTSSNGAGAFGATMNFSTTDYNPKQYIELNNSYGSFNSWKNTVKFGSGLIGKHLTIDGRFSSIRSDGFIDRGTSNLQSGYFSAGYWGKKTALRFNAILGKEKTYQAWNGVPETLLHTNRTYNSAGTDKSGSPYDNETDNYWQNHFQLFWNQQLKNGWKTSTALFYTPGHGFYENYKSNQKLSNYGLPPITVGNTAYLRTDLVRKLWLDTDFFGQTFSLQQQKPTHQFTMGGGWSQHNGRHFGEVISTTVMPLYYAKYYNLTAYKTDLNLYTKYQRPINKVWELFADVQYRYINYTINGFRNNPIVKVQSRYHFINPKIGASFKYQLWSGFISYALANKEPNRDDFEAGISQQPKREQLHDIELNVKRTNILDGLDITATGYYMQYKDQLVLTGKINDVGAYTRTNIPKSLRAGLELEANYRAATWNVAYSVAVSSNKIQHFTEYIDNYDNGDQALIDHGTTNISFSPAVVQNLSVNVLPINNLEIGWLGKYVGQQYLDNTSSKNRSLDAFLVNDFKAAYTLHGKWIKEARIAFIINNIFNVKYEPNGYTFSYINGGTYQYENYYFPMAGTNFMVALNFKL